MSLTSLLGNRNSNVRAFFEERFPGTRKVTGEVNALLRGVETIRPVKNVTWTTMGIAFDYRMRYHFAVTPYQELVAWNGALKVSDSEIMVSVDEDAWVGVKALLRIPPLAPGDPSLSKETIESFFGSLDETLSEIQPAGRMLNREKEELLLRYCVVLAHFDACFRAKPSPTSPLFSIGKKPTVDDLLNLAEPHWIDDLRVLTQGMVNKFDLAAFGNVVLNPTFSGSSDVGGADADLILDGCLIEIKTTIRASIEKMHVYQLLGYVLLEYYDDYKLENAGFYMARQCQLVTWPIKEILERLMPDKPPALTELRREFREVAGIAPA